LVAVVAVLLEVTIMELLIQTLHKMEIVAELQVVVLDLLLLVAVLVPVFFTV
jgi:hypothetical protein